MQLRQLQEPFSDYVLHTALATNWIDDASKLMIIHGQSPDRTASRSTYLLKSVDRVIALGRTSSACGGRVWWSPRLRRRGATHGAAAQTTQALPPGFGGAEGARSRARRQDLLV